MKRFKELFGIKFTKLHVIMIVIACIINSGLFLLTYFTGIPLVLDIVGTAYISFLLGPTAGIIAAIINMFLQLSFYKVVAFVNLFSSLAVALIVGLSSRNKEYKNFFAVLGVVFLSYLVGTLISSLVPVLGINMSNNDTYINLVYESASSLLRQVPSLGELGIKYIASLIASALTKLIDVLASAILVFVAYNLTPKRARDDMLSHHLYDDGDE